MKFFWAIIVAGIIVYLSGVSFTMLKIAMGDNPSIIATIFQLTPFLIGIWLIKYSWVKITYTEKIEEISSNTDTSLSKAVLNHSKELIKEIKPAINDYVDKHTKIENPDNFKEEESNMINSEINEDEIYENVLLEIEEDNKVKSTWAKALSQSDGDDKKAQSLYIKLRVDSLVIEKKTQIENERKKVEEQNLILKQEQEKLEQEKLEQQRLEKEKLDEEKKIQQEKYRKAEIEANADMVDFFLIGTIIIIITYVSYILLWK